MDDGVVKCDWLCYILLSVDGCRTYVGATDNLLRRVGDHNGLHGISRGAKATKGRQWYPVLFIDGFPNKIACLSFETGVRRIARRRKGIQYTVPRSLSPMHRRVLCVHNLLYAGARNGKWCRDGLRLNWLEREWRNPLLTLPPGVEEVTELDKMKLEPSLKK